MVKVIRDDEPLPRHTKLKYNECYAKIVLEDMFPEQFKEMEIKDKPDLQNEYLGIGVEITCSRNQKQLEAESLYVKWSYEDNIDKGKIEKQISKCGAKLSNGILSGIPDRDSFDRIYEALKDKLKKLSSGEYKSFSKQYLFIHSDIHATSTMRKDAIQEMHCISSDSSQKFDGVYVLVPSAVYVFDFANNITYERKINNNKQEQQSWSAREMVVQGEKGKAQEATS